VLAAISGHKNIATTQRYIELNDNVLREAVELA
jgi:site-specific recombinase XerD